LSPKVKCKMNFKKRCKSGAPAAACMIRCYGSALRTLRFLAVDSEA
jgi:hypothetical protein